MNTKTKIDLTYCEDCSSVSFVRPSKCLLEMPQDKPFGHSYPINKIRIAQCKILNRRDLIPTRHTSL